MEKLIILGAFFVVIMLGFYIMGKIDTFRREQSRKKGFPMDEED